MKHIYYGLKKESYVNKSYHHFSDIDTRLQYKKMFGDHCYYTKDRLLEEMKELEEGKETYYLTRAYKVVDDEIFIASKQHDHVCGVGDHIKLGNHEGKINQTKYDAVNDVMHYYTNIVVIEVESEDIEEKLQQFRESFIKEYQKLINEYYPESVSSRPPKQEKKLWQKLLGW